MSGKARGGKKKFINHKGGNRHFTDFEELKAQQAEIKKEKEKEDDSDEDEQLGGEKGADAAAKSVKPKKEKAAPNKKESSGSDASGSSDESDDDEGSKKKGVQHLIDIENPNRVKQKQKKVTDLKLEVDPSQMSRKEREAAEKERARQEYQRLHALGKTDEAQADLARLQIIRKQREEAAKKRDGEKIAKEEAEKLQQTQKLAGVTSMKSTVAAPNKS